MREQTSTSIVMEPDQDSRGKINSTEERQEIGDSGNRGLHQNAKSASLTF